MAPAIAPRAQVRGARAAIRGECRGYLGDLQLEQRRLDDHLRRELHPRRLQTEPVHDVAAKSAQPAMEITDVAAKEQTADERECGIAQIAVQKRHRPRLNAALEP